MVSFVRNAEVDGGRGLGSIFPQGMAIHGAKSGADLARRGEGSTIRRHSAVQEDLGNTFPLFHIYFAEFIE